MKKINTVFMGKRLYRPAVGGCLLIGLSACSVSPTPMTLEQKMAMVEADKRAMFEGQEPITQPITLEEAMARAVKYNLQERLSLMETLAQERVLELKSMDMLPQLAASAGWQSRSNEAASSSKSIATGRQSLVASTSQDTSTHSAGLDVSWNILDFGIGYFGAKAQANNVLAAEERRRTVVADIIQKVRSAYWDAVTAQRLQPVVKKTLAEANGALEKARKTEKERLVSPLDALKYQKSLLEMIRQLERLEGDLAMSKSRLASLMNLPPAMSYQLAHTPLQPTTLHYKLEDLEAFAMVNRPEINEEAYQARNLVLETRSALTRLLPGASLFVGSRYNSNSYLTHHNWAEAGVQVSWNLVGLFSYSKIKKMGEAKQSIAELRRQALRMAVLTQVNIAWQQYQQANAQFEKASELLRVQNAILTQTSGAYQNNAQSLVERVRMNTETVLAIRDRDHSFAHMQSAYGAIYQAAGLDSLPDQITGRSVAALSASIAMQRQLLNEGKVADFAPVANLKVTQKMPLSTTAHTLADINVVTPSLHGMNKSLDTYGPWQTLGSLQEVQVKDYTYYSSPADQIKDVPFSAGTISE